MLNLNTTLTTLVLSVIAGVIILVLADSIVKKSKFSTWWSLRRTKKLAARAAATAAATVTARAAATGATQPLPAQSRQPRGWLFWILVILITALGLLGLSKGLEVPTWLTGWLTETHKMSLPTGGVIQYSGTIAIVAMVLMTGVVILLFLAKWFRGFVGMALMILLFGSGVIWVVNACKDSRHSKSVNSTISRVQTHPGEMRVMVTSNGFTAIEYPEGYDWSRSIHGPGGENTQRPVTILLKKGGVPVIMRPEDSQDVLLNLPVGSGSLLVKIVDNDPSVSVESCILTVVTQKVRPEGR